MTTRCALGIWIVGAVVFIGGCLAGMGCTTTLENAGDVGFRYSTEFAFFHRAAKTSGADKAVSNTEFPALVEWFLEGPPPEGATTVTVTDKDPQPSPGAIPK